MKTYAVVFAPEAEDDLLDLYRYVAEHGSPVVAAKYTDAIVDYCGTLATAPHRGQMRDDVRPGLRITNYKRRAVIAFVVDDPAGTVSILGVYYGGKSYEAVLGEHEDD